jgi:hypothetical protein
MRLGGDESRIERAVLLLPLAEDKTAGLPFCTAEPPAGRVPWMARVHVPEAAKGAFASMLTKDP